MTLTSSSTDSDAKVRPPKIKAKWQDKFLKAFSQQPKEVTEAWALFSYSGWADQGQIMVFGSSSGGTAMIVNPASRAIDKNRKLSQVEVSGIRKAAQAASSLKDLESGVMDGINYEYVAATRGSDGTAKATQRVYMNNPGVNGPDTAHVALVKAFRAIAK